MDEIMLEARKRSAAVELKAALASSEHEVDQNQTAVVPKKDRATRAVLEERVTMSPVMQERVTMSKANLRGSAKEERILQEKQALGEMAGAAFTLPHSHEGAEAIHSQADSDRVAPREPDKEGCGCFGNMNCVVM
eukprot:TRINITY_DN5014_c0_g1_i2.p2 TRINITY_DN5014_c0_g1~~TRINITY_DN5014_c0_g1_i2.p2  ORF type:complete len:135 (+),score=46.08 TRINITY_DN5014_c0_g1_i2:314-718(+)